MMLSDWSWSKEKRKRKLLICPNCFTEISHHLRGIGYNLRVGYGIILNKKIPEQINKEKIEKFQKEGIMLVPGQRAVIVTKEALIFDNNVCGTIQSKGKISRKGILVQNTTIDPNYFGPIVISIYNASDKLRIINYDEEICCLALKTTALKYNNGFWIENKFQEILDYKSIINIWKSIIKYENPEHASDIIESFSKDCDFHNRLISHNVQWTEKLERFFIRNSDKAGMVWVLGILLVSSITAIILNLLKGSEDSSWSEVIFGLGSGFILGFVTMALKSRKEDDWY